ncbi:CBS domain-containing protein [Amycolatopsis sp. CB00013]|uniref:CBS domain-containing protein n=1 Tax=Amycolatopsis sp. CB00013 TaxID=1703945 RepID=UPI001F521997|nr:CBS domain-containing protein [Amycolatopsis sp. CB00013]
MRVRDVMTTPVIAVTPAATIGEAIAVLTGRGITSLPVVGDTGELLGLLVEEDLLRARYLAGSDPDSGVMLSGHTKVSALMRRPVAGAHPDGDLTDLTAKMLERRLRSVPVLEHGRVIGVITWQDLLRAGPSAQRKRP